MVIKLIRFSLFVIRNRLINKDLFSFLSVL